MLQYSPKDLFQYQTELIDAKVETAVNKAIDKFIEHVDSLKNVLQTEMREFQNEMKHEFHEFRQEVNTRFNVIEGKLDAIEVRLDAVEVRLDKVETRLDGIDNRLNHLENRQTAVETKLGLRNEIQSELKSRLVEYIFKAGWLLLATLVSVMLLYFHMVHL